MAQTVVGLFNSASEAQQAVQELTTAGFVRDNVDVSAHQQATATSGSSDYQNTSGTATEGAADAVGRTAHKAEDGIGSFFGTDEREALAEIADPVARAVHVVRQRASHEARVFGRIHSLEGEVARLVNALTSLARPSKA